MSLREEYPEVVNELFKLGSYPRSQLLAEVTSNHVTPEIEEAISEMRRIRNVGEKTALEILFAIAINLE